MWPTAFVCLWQHCQWLHGWPQGVATCQVHDVKLALSRHLEGVSLVLSKQLQHDSVWVEVTGVVWRECHCHRGAATWCILLILIPRPRSKDIQGYHKVIGCSQQYPTCWDHSFSRNTVKYILATVVLRTWSLTCIDLCIKYVQLK